MKRRIIVFVYFALSSFCVFAQEGNKNGVNSDVSFLTKQSERLAFLMAKNAKITATSRKVEPQILAKVETIKSEIDSLDAVLAELKSENKKDSITARPLYLKSALTVETFDIEALDSHSTSNRKNSERGKDSLKLIKKYLPFLVQAFDYADVEEITTILDKLLDEEFVPRVLVDTVYNYAVATGLAVPGKRGFLFATNKDDVQQVQMVDRVNFFGDYGILPNWNLYGDSVAYKAGNLWEIRGKLHPSYYDDSQKRITYPYVMELVKDKNDYHPVIRKKDMACVYSFYSNKRYHPTYKKYKTHTGNDYHTLRRKSDNPEDIHSECAGVVRVRKDDPKAGKSMAVRYFNGGESVVKHMSEFGEFVPGDTVYPGDILGQIGNTGKHTTGEHVCHTFTFVGITINALYLTNWNEFLRFPDPKREASRYAQTVELKKELEEWHKGVPTGELRSSTIIIHEPGSAKTNKNPFICPSVDKCRIEILEKEVVSQSLSDDLFQASKP